MRTSLNEIMLIEKYLKKELPVEEKLIFEARMLTNPSLRINVWLQQRIIGLVRIYHRKKIRQKAAEYHQRYFHDPQRYEYRKQITDLFKPQSS